MRLFRFLIVAGILIFACGTALADITWIMHELRPCAAFEWVQLISGFASYC